MKSIAISLALGLAAGAASLALAQDRGSARSGGPFPDRTQRGALTPDDRAALMDGRIAGLKAALRLTPDQEKLWPPVEEALRDIARQRAEAWAAHRERWASMRADRAADRPAGRSVPDELRTRADRMTASGSAMRKLADASAPLYATLDEGQRRRLGTMIRMAGPGFMRGHRQGGQRHGMMEELGIDQGRRHRHGAIEERGRAFADRENDLDSRRSR